MTGCVTGNLTGFRLIAKPRIETIQWLLTTLDGDGWLRPLPARKIKHIGDDAIGWWLQTIHVHSWPTLELVSWLDEEIGEHPAIEIGSGVAGLGRALGIPMTDARIHDLPEVQYVFRSMGQQPIPYRSDVPRATVAQAVAQRRPHTVIAAWVTELDKGEGIGSAYGVDYEELLEQVERIIFIGSEGVHGKMRILKRPHETITPPWLVSRSNRNDDWIKIWTRK